MANDYKRLGYAGSGSSSGSSFVKDPVADLVNLPAVNNSFGDLRYVNAVDQWYQWNGGSWESWVTYLTADTVLITDAGNFPISSGVTATELSYLTGVSSNIQDQINALGTISIAFNSTGDWLGPSAGQYTLVILQSSHLKAEPITEVFELNGSDFDLVHTNVSIDPSTNIVISVSEVPDLRFAGKITIS